MSTRIYGRSDDLIEFDGDVYGEVSCASNYDAQAGIMVICSDGTILDVKYSRIVLGVWNVALVARGTLLDSIEPCVDEDADPYSDVATFRDGLKWAYAAHRWERVQ